MPELFYGRQDWIPLVVLEHHANSVRCIGFDSVLTFNMAALSNYLVEFFGLFPKLLWFRVEIR